MEIDSPIRGCDLSSHQVYTNWDEIDNNYDFVIIRSTIGNKVDEKFNEFYNSANDQGIDIGVYTYNVMSSKNSLSLDDFNSKVNEKIEYLVTNLKDKKIDYPVFLDIEFDSGEISDLLPSEYINSLLEIFEYKMISNGYIPGVYTNNNTYQYIENCVGDIRDRFELWIAGGNDYDRVISIEKLNNNIKFDDKDIVQSYSKVVNGGAGDGAGQLDVNYSNVNYAYVENTDKERRIMFTLLGLDFIAVACTNRVNTNVKKKTKVKDKTKERYRNKF